MTAPFPRSSGSVPRVAILIDKPDWHARQVKEACEARGVAALWVTLQACDFATDSGAGLRLPEFENGLPDGAFVRCVPGGSFEQVTRRLGILHALSALGVPVFNDARAIERCVDKSATTFHLQRAQVPTPATWTYEDEAEARRRVRQELADGHHLVAKPLFGSQGRGLIRIEAETDLPTPDELSSVYYLQRIVGRTREVWHDWRVLVAGGEALAAMVRHGAGWITNMHQGAEAESIPLAEPLTGLAVAAARAVGVGYCGVDIIRDQDGRYLVLEVNSMPAWSGLQKVTGRDLTQALVDAFLESLDRAPAIEAAGA